VTLALDSWVILAWLKDQPPGAGAMAALWEQAEAGRVQLVMNIVNLGEVFYLVAKARGEASARTVLQNLQARRLEIVPAPDDLVLEAATLKARYPISYADAFAAATALARGAPLVTGDPEMRSLTGEGLRLEWAGVE
jgi:predicted nucleic acid-binding protein